MVLHEEHLEFLCGWHTGEQRALPRSTWSHDLSICMDFMRFCRYVFGVRGSYLVAVGDKCMTVLIVLSQRVYIAREKLKLKDPCLDRELSETDFNFLLFQLPDTVV